MSAMKRLKKSKEVDEFDADSVLWETRQLGASPEHAVRSSAESEKAFDDALGLQLLTIRLQKPLIEQFKKLAVLEGIGYQTLMRQVLTRYARENQHRIKRKLSGAKPSGTKSSGGTKTRRTKKK